jgi:heptosyltransferase-3
MKILFITANRLGDAVLSTGVLAWLIGRHPGAQVTIVCGPYAAGLFRAVPVLERLIVLQKRSWNRHWLDAWAACAGTRWDIIVDLRNSIVSRLLFARSRACRGGSTGRHKVIENAMVLGLTPPPAPRIWLDEKAEREAAQILPAGKPLLALGPAANWACKQWPAEQFAALTQKLADADGPLAGASVLVIAEEKERVGLSPLLKSIPVERRIELFGRDLLTVAACLKQARLFIGNDSGLMHLAAAIGVPTLGLFGPGQEDIYGPWGENGAYVRTPESRDELLRRLPYPAANHPNLMEGLSVETVYQAAYALLDKVK